MWFVVSNDSQTVWICSWEWRRLRRSPRWILQCQKKVLPLKQWQEVRAVMGLNLHQLQGVYRKSILPREKQGRNLQFVWWAPFQLPRVAGRTRLSSTASNDSNKSRGKSKAPVNSDKAAASTGGTAPTTDASSPAPAKEAITNPMDLLVAAASSMNPRQFELPREMLVPIIFPGTDKGKLKRTPWYLRFIHLWKDILQKVLFLYRSWSSKTRKERSDRQEKTALWIGQ